MSDSRTEITAASLPARSVTDGVVSVLLAVLIIGAWFVSHVYAVFFLDLSGWAWGLAPLLVWWLTWLTVGLFIIAHDCMHGSFVPGKRTLNTAVGTLCLIFYAGFSYWKFKPKHFDHHRNPGTSDDPDFHDETPHDFAPWFWNFMTEYFGLREYLTICVITVVYCLLLGASVHNVLVFWALPAILSAVQLFYFGTYLPHKPHGAGFDNKHNARSNDYSWLVSLLTCFHFGYHEEHHEFPGTPWWRLPRARAYMLARDRRR